MIPAEYFDIFGVFGFCILLYIGIRMLKSKRKMPKYVSEIIIIIAILGLFVDGDIVLSNFLLT